MARPQQLRRRKGTIILLTAFLLIVVVALMAMAIDTGYVYMARAELQRSADASAIAGASKLIESAIASPTGAVSTTDVTNVRSTTASYAAYNHVTNKSLALATEDIQVGKLSSPTNPACAFDFTNVGQFNAVHAHLRRTANQNGKVRMFFAPVLDRDSIALTADATAAFVANFKGFAAPTDTDQGNLKLLPFALDQQTWNSLMAGTGADTWRYNSATGGVMAGTDGVKECNLYPQGTGSPGNRGTVDIGGSNNSTNDIARQIVYGISQSDLDQIGGSLKFGASGTLSLNGDTGISAGVKDELESIKGKPRIIPIFSTVAGPGNNAQYTIVKFAGVRIVEVVLTGKATSKRVMIQPAPMVVYGGIPATDSSPYSQFLFSPVRLVR